MVERFYVVESGAGYVADGRTLEMTSKDGGVRPAHKMKLADARDVAQLLDSRGFDASVVQVTYVPVDKHKEKFT